MTPISGRFYRIIFAQDLPHVLDGASSPEGRFHHTGQTAIYLSPNERTAAVAIDSYYCADDPERLIVPVLVSGASVCDFRNPATSRKFELSGRETTVNWRCERRSNHLASSWQASDAARDAGADGLVYFSRKSPPLWHLVLFRWSTKNPPLLSQDGPPLAFNPAKSLQ